MNIILADMSWPEAFIGIIGIICYVSLLMGKWPWEKDNK